LIGIAVIANFAVPFFVKTKLLDFKPLSCEKCLAFWISIFFLALFENYSNTDTVLFSFVSYQISGLIYKYL
jgi:hypothetical protein